MMNCPTCATPNQASGRNCRKCGVLVVSFGAPSKAVTEQKSFSFVPGLGTLALLVVLGYAGYFFLWPKAQDVSPVAQARHASSSSLSDLFSGGGSLSERLQALTKKARKQEDGHTDAMVHELENSGVVSQNEIGSESVAAPSGSNPKAARDAANAATAAQAQELSKIGAQ